MPAEVAAIGVAASAGNAFITLWKHGAHFLDIPAEVEQFKVAIDNLETSINTARRVRRINSRYLDEVTKSEVDNTIQRSVSVLDSISRTIEKCRADLQIKGTVSAKNRIDWIFSGHDQFMARGMTLNSCLHVLGMQIQRMDAMQPSAQMTARDPPSYKDSLAPEQRLRAPSVRRKPSQLISRRSFSNLSTFSFSTEKELANENPTDTVSVYSEDDASLTGTLTSIPHLSCAGDYCTDEFCINHTRGMCPLTNTLSLDRGIRQHESSNFPETSATGSSSDLRLNLSRKRRNKSGLM